MASPTRASLLPPSSSNRTGGKQFYLQSHGASNAAVHRQVVQTPTGTNVPDYPRLAQLWWQNVSLAVTGEKTPQEAMDKLATEMDDVMSRLERSGMQNCPPKLNPPKDPKEWLAAPGAPRPKVANEKPKGETVPYEQLLQAWREGRVK